MAAPSESGTVADDTDDVPHPRAKQDSPDDEEARLVDAAVAGNQAAFAALYDRHLDRVFRFCYYRTGNRSDAEDLTQQTFLQAWRAIGGFRRGGAPFAAWLLVICQRLAISHHRKARATVSLDAAAALAAPAASPVDAVLASLDRAALRAAILRLKPDRQHVILLRFIGGFEVAAVAAALDKTDNHVRVLQHRALADLRQLLTEPTSAEPATRQGLADTVRDVAAAARRLVDHARR